MALRATGRVDSILAALERLGTRRTRDGMARYGIHAERAYGVTMAAIQKLAKEIGRDHALAEALWSSGWYEARLLAAFVDEPERVTAAQMDRWCRDFDNWAVCDTVCFKLFDRTAHAYAKVERWSNRRKEFEKRAAFALLASLALHDKRAGDEAFARTLPLIERAASDDRNFVKKAVSWALRSIGRRNAALRVSASALARRLAGSADPAPRWVGKDALRDLK
jgi:3-methyladenine DNA glycosylase AlkD